MTRAVTFWTDSGGGGKSTMSMNVAHALERDGHRVVVWDIDQQRGCLTKNIGFKEYLADGKKNALEAVFNDEKTLRDVILSADDHEGLPFDLIPGTLQWEKFEDRVNMAEVANRWMLFRQAIIESNLHENYDVIIIDAEGRRGLKERNAIVATQNVIIPVFPNPKGMDDVASGRDYIYNKIQKGLERSGVDMNFAINAVVPNKVKQSKNVHKQVVRRLREEPDIPVAPFEMFDRGPYDDASLKQMTLFQFAESDETRDLYGYEEEILEKYEYLARVVLSGSVNEVSTERFGAIV